jgi:putative tricarboxylic transport membrane protein
MAVRNIKQHTGEVVGGALFLVVGLIWIAEALRMPRGEFAVPGPGFFPLFLGIGLSIAAILNAILATIQRASTYVQFGNFSIWSTIIALIVLAAVFEPLGFIPSIALFIGFYLRLLVGFRWWLSGLLGLGAASVVYLIFSKVLGIHLPPIRWL